MLNTKIYFEQARLQGYSPQLLMGAYGLGFGVAFQNVYNSSILNFEDGMDFEEAANDNVAPKPMPKKVVETDVQTSGNVISLFPRRT